MQCEDLVQISPLRNAVRGSAVQCGDLVQVSFLEMQCDAVQCKAVQCSAVR